MFDLTISPQGHLLLRETSDGSSARGLSKRLLDAYKISAAEGMLQSAGDETDAALPPAYDFARSIGRLYLAELVRVAIADGGEAAPEVPPPMGDLDGVVRRAPPMTGLEYLNVEAVAGWWRDLDALARAESAKRPGGVQEFLRERNPHWRTVGRVTFHLAEHKRDPDYPFAFLATFANGLTPQGKVKHEPLSRALQQYAGERNREAMLKLLIPVSKAAEASPFVRRLVESGDVYRPLAWPARSAYEFLKAVPLFESSGLIVRVPDWWNARKPPRPTVNVKVDVKDSARVGVDALMDFSIGMSLDGESLDPREIAALLESTGGLVPLRGKWVEVDREKINQALEHWKGVERDVQRGGLTFFEGMRLLSGADLTRGDPEAAKEGVREWSGLTPGPVLEETLQRLRSPEAEGETAPPGLQAQLRPYQRAGYGWLRFTTRLGLGACLADDMGLGKTVQVISLLLDLKRDAESRASLLVVPASLIANWKSELAKFAPSLTFAVVHPSEAAIEPDQADTHDLVMTTYGMLVRTEWLRKHRWRLAILDEAQAVKNSGAKQTRAVKELTADARIAMTGTPVENRPSDLWSLFDFLNPGLLGPAKRFASFVKALQSGPTPSFEPLRDLVQPYILRRLKTDKRVIADLPDKTEVNAYCSLSKHQAVLYQHAVDDLAHQLDTIEEGIDRRGLVLSQLMRLKQICNHPAQATGSADYDPDRSGKFHRLAEIAEEIASRQEKVLVFTQFREITEPLAEALARTFGRTGLILHGGTPVKKRKELVDQFQREDGPPFFVLSLKAGGTGLNLTAASHVIHFDRWWNPAVENQATDRAFRIGQKRNVLVHKFVCRGTVEERIDEMIASKSRVAEELVGGDGSSEMLLTEMDNDTLLRFVALDLSRAAEG
ncbi:DEAD/DEAH box helicase [Paludisphaera rhizosphaerae]|uniref:DEAD/DEAH box helicase n=1 Tax=Paludisphaera rhizosphaerae TaxID=2711216 RepID=UPI0013EA32CE|nr:DEAD/DEAH box helicase [Paludisphaera rhizosphaerae]